MHLNEILRPEMVWPRLSAKTKHEAIEELARRIAESDAALDGSAVATVLFEREKLGSTGIQDGVAIPHAKVPGLAHILIAFGRSLDGIDFQAHDGKPTHLFFVLLAPAFASGQHLKALARLSRILKDASFRDELMAAQDAQELYNAIVREDART